jgi:hypothetical protein
VLCECCARENPFVRERVEWISATVRICECQSQPFMYAARTGVRRSHPVGGQPDHVGGGDSPRRWVEVVAGAKEPSFEPPRPERRGLVERRGQLFLHFCTECGRWGAYGYGATGDNPGRWYCWLHRPDG